MYYIRVSYCRTGYLDWDYIHTLCIVFLSDQRWLYNSFRILQDFCCHLLSFKNSAQTSWQIAKKLFKGSSNQVRNHDFSLTKKIKTSILFVTSNLQTTNFVFSTNFSQFEQLKTNKLFIGSKQVFLSFGPMKSLFSFSTAKTEKYLREKLGKTRFIVWWFDLPT